MFFGGVRMETWKGAVFLLTNCFPIFSTSCYSLLPSMTEKRAYAAAALLFDELIVVAGGQNDRGRYLSSVECIQLGRCRATTSPSSSTSELQVGWRRLAPMNKIRGSLSLCWFRDCLLAVGGVGIYPRDRAELGSVEVLSLPDLEQSGNSPGQWTEIAPLKEPMDVFQGLLTLTHSVVAVGTSKCSPSNNIYFQATIFVMPKKCRNGVVEY